MNIKDLAKEIAAFEGIRRKYPISELVLPFSKSLLYKYPQLDIVRSFGEDAAVLNLSNVSDTHYFLLALDGMWSKLIDADPKLAGYFAVLVNVNDIVCKGGIPIALLDMLSYQNKAVGKLLVEGLVLGCEKFNVPIIGGHLHPNDTHNVLSVAVFGIVPKTEAIFSDNAQIGDDIIIALDLDGKFHEKFLYAWDTTSHKSPAEVQAICSTMQTIARQQLAHAAKDISNPGIVGTLGMLLDASQKGGVLNLAQIPHLKEPVSLQWLCMYPGFGIVCSCDPAHSRAITEIFAQKGITARVCGTVQGTHSLFISDWKEEALVLDLTKNHVSGIAP
jgi:selenophosphate synthetase-related protein